MTAQSCDYPLTADTMEHVFILALGEEPGVLYQGIVRALHTIEWEAEGSIILLPAGWYRCRAAPYFVLVPGFHLAQNNLELLILLPLPPSAGIAGIPSINYSFEGNLGPAEGSFRLLLHPLFVEISSSLDTQTSCSGLNRFGSHKLMCLNAWPHRE